MNITDLPQELQLHIISNLKVTDVIRLARTNNHYHHLCRDNQIWQRLTYQDYLSDITSSNSWLDTYIVYYKLSVTYTASYRIYGNSHVIGNYLSKNDALLAIIENCMIDFADDPDYFAGLYNIDLSEYPKDILVDYPSKCRLWAKVKQYLISNAMGDTYELDSGTFYEIDTIKTDFNIKRRIPI